MYAHTHTRSPSQVTGGAELSTLQLSPTHTILPNPNTHVDSQGLDTMDTNAAYEHSTFSHSSIMAPFTEGELEEGVYDNELENPTYATINQ